jgi:DNA replication and repair protein RecF
VNVRLLRASGWRNLAPVALEPGPRATVFFGHNGQGKTNLLEAAHYLVEFRSFRTRTPTELVGWQAPEAKLAAEVEVGPLTRRIDVLVGVDQPRDPDRVPHPPQRGSGGRSPPTPHAAAAPTRKQVRVDGKSVRRDSPQLRGLGVVVFLPEDLLLPRAAPSARRSFLDRAAYNVDRLFYAEAVAYQKVLRSRNLVLRRGTANATLLDTYDQQLARTGARLVMRRRAIATALAPRVQALFVSLHAEIPAVIQYRSAPTIAEATSEADVAQALEAGLGRDREVDLRRRFTGTGPHTDDLDIHLGGRPVREHGSQGQLRSLVLSLKLAELANLADTLGEPPLLLLDDVASELDGIRRHKLFETITALPGQTFITVTDRDLIPTLPGRLDFQVSGGVISHAG